MWSINSSFKTNRLLKKAQLSQDKLLSLNLDPIQKAFAAISLSLLTYRELIQYVFLANNINKVPTADFSVFLDNLYNRLYQQKSDKISSDVYERLLIRCSLIGILLLMIKGFNTINYYSISSFGILFLSLLLFWHECRKKVFWTVGITFLLICVYNPIYKAHFTRIQWIALDQKLVAALFLAIIIDFATVYIRRIKLPRFSGVKLKVLLINKLTPRKLNFHITKSLGVWIWYTLVFTLICCTCCLFWPAGLSTNYYIASTPVQPIGSGNLVSDSYAPSTNLYDSIKTRPDPYLDWDAVAYKTGSRPFGFKFKTQYGEVNNALRVIVGADRDAVIKLTNVKTHDCIRYVYIKAYDSFDITHIPLGIYNIRIATGKVWKQKTINGRIIGRFTENAIYKKGEEDLNFYVHKNKYSSFDLKLNAQSGADNFNTSVLSEDEFNN